MKSSRLAQTLLIVTIFAVVVLVVDPRGNMPLDDDWNFALSAWHFADTGEFRFARFTGMSLRAQVVWGALWTKLFGKSFEVLRASTLFLALGTLLLFHRLLLHAGASRRWALLGALTLFAHPIFLWCSFTYMTHVPFVFLSVAALYCAIRGVKERKLGLFVIAGAFVVLSTLVRQTGIASIAPLVTGVALSPGLRGKRSWWSAAVAPLALFVFFALFTNLLRGYPGQIEEHVSIWREGALSGISTALVQLHRYFSFNAEYAFIFLLPLAPLLLAALREERRTRRVAAVAALIIGLGVAFQLLLARPLPYPTPGNVFVNFALGPLTLRDTWLWEFPYPFALPYAARVALTLVAAAGGAILVAVAAEPVRRSWVRLPTVEPALPVAEMAVSHAVAATLALVASAVYFDRYALDSTWSLIVVVILVAGPGTSPESPEETDRAELTTSPAVVLLAAVALLSVAGTAEYLDWNRARWEGFHYLRARGVTLEQMDGGYEINQYLLGGWDGVRERGKLGLAVEDDAYVLSFHRVTGYKVLKSFHFRRLLGRDGFVYALQRTGEFHPWEARQHLSE